MSLREEIIQQIVQTEGNKVNELADAILSLFSTAIKEAEPTGGGGYNNHEREAYLHGVEDYKDRLQSLLDSKESV